MEPRITPALLPTLLAVLLLTPARAQTPAPSPGPSLYHGIMEQMGGAFAKNDYATAVELLGTIPETAPPHIVVRKHTAMALALSKLDRYSEVPPHLERARAVAKRVNDPGTMALAESAAGSYYLTVGQFDLSLAAFREAEAYARSSGDRNIEGRVYAQLSSLYSRMEDWERAANYGAKAFELIEQPSPTERFNYLMNRGTAHVELYDRDMAETIFKEALVLAVAKEGIRDRASALGELASVYWTFDRDAAAALSHSNQAIDLARQAKEPTMIADRLTSRGNVFRDTGEYTRALEDYAAALALSPGTFPTLKNTGQVYRLMGRLGEARTLLETLLRDRPGNPGPRHVWQAHMELASTYEALQLRDQAEAEYRRMLDVLEEHRHTSILDVFRSGSFAHRLSNYDPYDRCIRFLLAGGDPRRAAEASLLTAERARARSLLEGIASLRSSFASALPPQLLEQQNAIMRDIASVQRRLRAPDLPQANRDALRKDLAALERQREDFRLKLRVEQPALAEARYPDVVEPARLQPVLRPDETALVFYLSEPESFRWVVTRTQVAVTRIAGRQAIELQAERLRHELHAAGDPLAARGHAETLAKLLFDGLQLAREALLVVPHGVLHYVPFEVLPHGGSLLVERHAISYVPSLNSIAHLRRVGGALRPFRVLAVGNPAVDRPDAPVASRAPRGVDIDTVGLLGPPPYAAEELSAIERTFGRRADTLSGADARESALRGAGLERYPVIHFATHGLVNERRASRSGLLLSPEAGEDGVLQLPEIYRLALRADLVVLSACQTALGREVTGEGIVGLTRAFFYAGAGSVLATLWNPDDRFAADFVQRFYQELRAGVSTEEALRRTKLAYLGHPQYSHPFYWSPLVLTGDGTRVLYRERAYTVPALAGLGVALLAIAVIVYWRRRR